MSTENGIVVGNSELLGKPEKPLYPVTKTKFVYEGEETQEQINKNLREAILNAYQKVINTSGTVAISDDGYWIVDGQLTDIRAKAIDADIWTIGTDGYWYLNGEKTEYMSRGEKGDPGKDGVSPMLRISTDGQSLEISSDAGETWLPFQKDFNKLRVLGYLDSKDLLPKSANVGDIYGVWNQQANDGKGAYELYINTVKEWVLDSTVTKIYDYDTELPSSAKDGTIAMVPVSDLTLDKEKVDGYKVYKYSLASSGWVMVLNTAEIYADKEDIINYGDNLYALVQGEGKVTETVLKEETVVSREDYCRIVNMSDKALLLMIVQGTKRMIHSINTGAYMLPNGCTVCLIKDSSVTDNFVIAPSMHVENPTHLSDLEFMPEGIYPYYVLTENCVGDIYITPEDKLTPGEQDEQNGLTIETKTTTLLSFKQNYEVYKRVVGWVYFGTNASITYHLIQDVSEGTETNVPSGKAVKDCCEKANKAIQDEATARQGADTVIDGKLKLLAKGVNVKLTVSPTVIYKNTATEITLTGQMLKATPTELNIIVDGTNHKSAANPYTYKPTVNVPDNSKAFQLEGVVEGMTFTDEVSVSARYPIYYGFGASAASVAVSANRYSATTSAVHTYSRQNTVSGQHFYILVPSDITDVSQFTMGGAPFVMNPVTTLVSDGITYRVHESSNTYNSGVTITVSAS